MQSRQSHLQSTNVDHVLSTSEHRLLVELIQEDDVPGYGIRAVNLPGAFSKGETIENAIRNIQEAAQGLIEVYQDDLKQPVPWIAI